MTTEDGLKAEDGLKTYREVEQKLRVHAFFSMPEFTELAAVSKVTAEEVRVMEAVYHDTEDLRLFRWKITLRRRVGGPDAGWHMKFPVDGEDGSVRDELQLPLSAGEEGQVPSALTDLVAALIRDKPLIAVASLHTERLPFILHDADGEAAVELVDDTVSIMDGERVAERFREIEVEALTPADAHGAVMVQVATLLQAHGAIPATTSKAATAVGPRALQPADVTEPGPVSPTDSAGAAVSAHLARHIRRFLLQDVRVRRDLPDAVHQMRVAARRIRSGLKGFGPLVDDEWSQHLRAELGWIAGELGAVRDTEVMIARLNERAVDLPPDEADLAQTAIDRILGARIIDARSHALAALRSERHLKLCTVLVAAANAAKLTPEANESCAEVLPGLVEKTWKKLEKDVARLHIDSAAHPWHETRIAGKKARYAAEAVEPVFGRRAKPLAKALAQVTEILGDHQDAHVAQLTLKSLATDDTVDAATGFAMGLLYGLEIDYEMGLRHEFRRVWPKIQDIHDQTQLTERTQSNGDDG